MPLWRRSSGIWSQRYGIGRQRKADETEEQAGTLDGIAQRHQA